MQGRAGKELSLIRGNFANHFAWGTHHEGVVGNHFALWDQRFGPNDTIFANHGPI
jgi:hypothetical protein